MCGGPTTKDSTPPSDTGAPTNSRNKDSFSKELSNTPLPIHSAACFCRMLPSTSSIALGPRLQWDDGFRHMASMPGILCQPAFQALSGRVSQVLHDLGRGHRCGEVQVHRALPFLGAEHVIILSFSLQENVRSPLSIVCLVVVGILVVEVLARTGAISIKHFLVSVDRK